MPIPGIAELEAPVLRVLSESKEEVRARELEHRVADALRLTENERDERLPSGAPVFRSRLNAALGRLLDQGSIERPQWGYYKITQNGKQRLGGMGTQAPSQPVAKEQAPDLAPEERMDLAYKELETALAQELLRRVRDVEPSFFERVVIQLLEKMGYGSGLEGAARVVGRSGDGGIDGVIHLDPLGLNRVYVQAKRYAPDQRVTAAQIREFSGALNSQRGVTQGVFITTSRFTDDARGTAANLPQRIVLIDGDELARLMIRYDVGVRVAGTFHVKKIDEDFFLEE